jgi:hypothetical protein
MQRGRRAALLCREPAEHLADRRLHLRGDLRGHRRRVRLAIAPDRHRRGEARAGHASELHRGGRRPAVRASVDPVGFLLSGMPFLRLPGNRIGLVPHDHELSSGLWRRSCARPGSREGRERR